MLFFFLKIKPKGDASSFFMFTKLIAKGAGLQNPVISGHSNTSNPHANQNLLQALYDLSGEVT